MSTLHLVRHLPAAGAGGRAIGRTDLELANPAAPRWADAWPLEPPVRVVASPSARAHQTATALADRWGLEVEAEPRLAEMDFGRWDGRTWAEIERNDADALGAWMADWTATPAPGGEAFADVQIRVRDWLDDVNGDAVVVAHAGPIRAVLVEVLGLDPAHAFRLVVAHGALTTVRLDPPELVVLNRPVP